MRRTLAITRTFLTTHVSESYMVNNNNNILMMMHGVQTYKKYLLDLTEVKVANDSLDDCQALGNRLRFLVIFFYFPKIFRLYALPWC